MMNRLSVHRRALPGALLELVKNGPRVRHNRDSSLMLAHLASAIGLVERMCNVSLNPAEYLVSAGEVLAAAASALADSLAAAGQ